VDLIFNSILYVTRDLVDNNYIVLLIVWFAWQRRKWSTWRWLIAKAETYRWEKLCKNILLIKNMKQVVFDYILPICFMTKIKLQVPQNVGSSWPTKELFPSQEELCSMELASLILPWRYTSPVTLIEIMTNFIP